MGRKNSRPVWFTSHSPTHFIALHNDWEPGSPWALTARRLEHYAITAADGLPLPKQPPAREAEEVYQLPKGSVHVIPLPIGKSWKWKNPSDMAEGYNLLHWKLERRKGVLEWIQAAVSVLRDYPEILFQFVGPNVLGTLQRDKNQVLDDLIPGDLRDKFFLRGPRPFSLPKFLAGARIGVVPSDGRIFRIHVSN